MHDLPKMRRWRGRGVNPSTEPHPLLRVHFSYNPCPSSSLRLLLLSVPEPKEVVSNRMRSKRDGLKR